LQLVAALPGLLLYLLDERQEAEWRGRLLLWPASSQEPYLALKLRQAFGLCSPWLPFDITLYIVFVFHF
jgi:hypothetical protein